MLSNPDIFERLVHMSIGDNIKKYRKKCGFTQLELATKANISRSYLGDLEKDRYNPSLDTLSAIAISLGIEVAILLNSTSNHINNKELTSRDKKDIAKDVQEIMDKIDSGEDGPLYYNGEEMSEEDKELFKDALEFALKRIKVENKQKYGRKNNR